jgi:hypothetical protein
MGHLKIFNTILVMTIASLSLAQTNNWPAVEPLHEKQTFADAASDADTPFLAFIKDVKGVPAYKLECHNGNYDENSGYNFSGTFQCALFAVSGDRRRTWNLLAVSNKDEQSTDWWNRGRMLSNQLRGECLAYPEYSTLRHFKLRGMLVTLQFTDIEWSTTKDQQGNPLLEKFTFTFDVVPDQTAQSPAAEPAAGPTPPSSCYP